MKKMIILLFVLILFLFSSSENEAASTLPDITIGSITVKALKGSDNKITLKITPEIKNISAVPINEYFNVRMVPYRRLPRGPNWFEELTKAYNITVYRMGPNETKKITFELPLGDYMSWEWKFEIIADPENGIQESNEDNNRKFSAPFQSTDLHRVQVVSLTMEPPEVKANQDRPTFLITLNNMDNHDLEADITILQPCDKKGRGIIYVVGGSYKFYLRPGMNTIRYIPCSAALFLGPEEMDRYPDMNKKEYGVCVDIEFPDAGITWDPNYWTPACEVPNRPGYYRIGEACSLSETSLSNLQVVQQEPKKIEKFVPEAGTVVTPIKASLPDLAVIDIRLVKNCLIEVTIKNNGSVPLPEEAYEAVVQMFNNEKPWGGIVLKGIDPQRRLKNPGGSVTFLWFPEAKNLRLSPGKHQIKLIVDYNNILKELDEKNNVMIRELTCSPLLPSYPMENKTR